MTDTPKIPESVQRELDRMAQLRDELKVHLHLAKADARDEWERLEKKFQVVQDEIKQFSAEAEGPLKEFSSASRGLLDELKKGYERVRSQLST